PGALRLALLQLGDARGSRLLRQLARQQEVAGVTAGHVDDVAAQADLLDVREEDDVHRLVAIAAAASAAAARALGRALGDVRQQRDLARPLDRGRDLVLVPPASARDAARADLALVRDVAPVLGDVLVVDLVDLLTAEV